MKILEKSRLTSQDPILIFTRIETVNILLDSLKFLNKEGLKIIPFVILENHTHLILQSDNLSKDIMRFKAHTAKQILQYLSENNVKQILRPLH